MRDIASFIAQYTEGSRSLLSFAWNGRHASEFYDANQEFRWEVAQACIAAPDNASPLLLEHLFLADAEWSREAWCAPHHFADLGRTLLVRGQEAAVTSFAKGFVSSFDTFGACHELQLPSELTARLLASGREFLAGVPSEIERKPFEAVVELFEKLQQGNAAKGWAKIGPGTPVSGIRVVSSPRWYHRVWGWLSSRWAGNAT